jgi:hypothetical protein
VLDVIEVGSTTEAATRCDELRNRTQEAGWIKAESIDELAGYNPHVRIWQLEQRVAELERYVLGRVIEAVVEDTTPGNTEVAQIDKNASETILDPLESISSPEPPKRNPKDFWPNGKPKRKE